MNIQILHDPDFSAYCLDHLRARHVVGAADGDVEVVFVRAGTAVNSRFLLERPALRLVVTVTTGIDHLDLDACAGRNVDIISLKEQTRELAHVPNTAELAFALILCLQRNLLEAVELVRNDTWQPSLVRGRTLQGRRLGLLGFGRLGAITARIANGFAMRVFAYDPVVDAYPEYVTAVDSLPELASNSDILSLHASLNEHNTGIINADVLDLLPDQAVLINTARGQLVNEGDLIRALESGKLAGAGLDVITGEHDIERESHPLIQYARTHPNLIITPHMGGQTTEAVEAADRLALREFEAWEVKHAP